MNDFDKYKNKCFYPKKTDYITFKLIDSSGKVIIKDKEIYSFIRQISQHLNLTNLNSKNMYENVAECNHAIFKEFKETDYNSHSEMYYNQERLLFDQFKTDLFTEFGVLNNPKNELCFSKAWNYGHSSGYSDVYNYFSDFVELIE